jgi:hypothetical protein
MSTSIVAALERLLLALGALAEAAPRIAEVNLNPVVVHQEGGGPSSPVSSNFSWGWSSFRAKITAHYLIYAFL